MTQNGIHFEVSGHLHEIIRYFYCIQTTEHFVKSDQHLSPNLEMMLIFNFGKPVLFSFGDELPGRFQVKDLAVVGPLRKMLNYQLLPEADLIIAEFNVDGFYRLFQLPMDQLDGADNLVVMELVRKELHELWQILASFSNQTDRVELLKEYLLTTIRDHDDALQPLFEGISYFNNPFVQPVRAIAEDAELSERTIQSRFKKYLGYSPKELLRFVRFKQVIASIQRQPNREVDWQGLIEEFGYHDQSHLIKDFHHYLGTTPQKFIKEISGKSFCVSKAGKYYS